MRVLLLIVLVSAKVDILFVLIWGGGGDINFFLFSRPNF